MCIPYPYMDIHLPDLIQFCIFYGTAYQIFLKHWIWHWNWNHCNSSNPVYLINNGKHNSPFSYWLLALLDRNLKVFPNFASNISEFKLINKLLSFPLKSSEIHNYFWRTRVDVPSTFRTGLYEFEFSLNVCAINPFQPSVVLHIKTSHLFTSIFSGPSALPYNTTEKSCLKRSDEEYGQVLQSYLKMG